MEFYKNALHVSLSIIRSEGGTTDIGTMHEAVWALDEWTLEKGKLRSLGKYASRTAAGWKMTTAGARALNRWNGEVTKMLVHLRNNP